MSSPLRIDHSTVRCIGELVEPYERAYWGEMRKCIAEYASVADAFGDWLRGAKRVEAYVTLEGLLVVCWPAETDSFEISFVAKSVQDAMNAVPGLGFTMMQTNVGSVGLMEWDHLGIELHHTDGSISRPYKWARVTVTADLTPERWQPKRATLVARNYALSLVTARLMKFPPGDPEGLTAALVEKIEAKMQEFKQLLDQEPLEPEIQRFLSENPVLLEPCAQRAMPQLRLGAEHACDFAVEVADAEYVLVEIERPSHKLFTKKGDPTKEVTHARRQAEDWQQWVAENISYARNALPRNRKSHVLGNYRSQERLGQEADQPAASDESEHAADQDNDLP